MEDGDEIAFDLPAGAVEWRVSDEEHAARRRSNEPRPIAHDRRYLAEFAATVAGADRGCVGKALDFTPMAVGPEG